MPAPAPSDIASKMRAALAISEPGLDTSTGSVTRKIIDAVAEVIAESFLDQHLVEYQYDIDSKSGDDLNDFVALFGFSRLPASRATGAVTFARPTASPSNERIAIGSQIASGGSDPILFHTTAPAILSQGQTSVVVPIEAILPGESGNLGAGQIINFVSPLNAVATVTNLEATTGGAGPESDEELRLRFKRTIFRNLAGTEDMFLAIALEATGTEADLERKVTDANVIGAVETHREFLEVVSGTATSTITKAQYIYPNTSVVGLNIDDDDILQPGTDYSLSTANPPVLTVLSATNMPDGIYEVAFDYLPSASRNDPQNAANAITNRVDVWVNGTQLAQATESVVFKTATTFNNTAYSAANPLGRAGWRRFDTDTQPTNGNIFSRLSYGPIHTVPSTIPNPGGGAAFVKGTDYWIVHDVTAFGLASGSLYGLEWLAASHPLNNAIFTVTDYSWNQVPRIVDEAIQDWRLVTQDVRTHQAKELRLRLNVAIIYTRGFTIGTVNTEIDAAMERFFQTFGFRGVVQFSDILETIAGVPGVDAVRFIHSSEDAVNYAAQRVTSTGTVITTYHIGGSVSDIFLADDELPIYGQVDISIKAQNTFLN